MCVGGMIEKKLKTTFQFRPPHMPPPAPPRLFTLALIHDPPSRRVLLGLKKRGFGAGRWNGFGGKVEPGETVAAAAARELTEECGLTAPGLERRGRLTFVFDDQPAPWEVHVFYGTAWAGALAESDEMAPRWFDEADIPYADMWADDAHWLPRLLAGERVVGTFEFTDTTTLVRHELESVEALPPIE